MSNPFPTARRSNLLGANTQSKRKCGASGTLSPRQTAISSTSGRPRPTYADSRFIRETIPSQQHLDWANYNLQSEGEQQPRNQGSRGTGGRDSVHDCPSLRMDIDCPVNSATIYQRALLRALQPDRPTSGPSSPARTFSYHNHSSPTIAGRHGSPSKHSSGYGQSILLLVEQ